MLTKFGYFSETRLPPVRAIARQGEGPVAAPDLDAMQFEDVDDGKKLVMHGAAQAGIAEC